MKQLRGMALLTGGALCFGVFAGCMDYDESDLTDAFTKDQNVALNQNLEKGQIVAARLQEKSLFKKHNLPTGTWRVHGEVPLAGKDSKTSELTRLDEKEIEPDKDDHASTSEPMVIIDNGIAYSVEFTEEELALITRTLEAEGLANGRPADDGFPEPVEEEFEPKAWAHGTDNRQPLGLNEYPLNSSSTAQRYQRIGALGGGPFGTYCTATLVGTPETAYYYITAAHCLFDDNGAFKDPIFYPRLDGCQNKLGASLPGCNVQPYGQWDTQGWVLLYQDWFDDCRGETGVSNLCVSYDIALVRVNKPANQSSPGAFGFGSYSNSFIKDRTNYLQGYPPCGSLGAPDFPGGCASPTSVCRVFTLYGATGDIGNTYNNGRRTAHGIDSSGGQSGSALYLNDNGNHRVFAVDSAGRGTCWQGCNIGKPNDAARITSSFYSWMLTAMGI